MLLTYRSLYEAGHLPPKIRKVVYACLQNLLDAYGTDYDPEDDGYVILYSEDTTDQDALDLFGRTWMDACLEGVIYDEEAKCFLTCVLTNNQFGYTIVVPDTPWLNRDFRSKLLAELLHK